MFSSPPSLLLLFILPSISVPSLYSLCLPPCSHHLHHCQLHRSASALFSPNSPAAPIVIGSITLSPVLPHEIQFYLCIPLTFITFSSLTVAVNAIISLSTSITVCITHVVSTASSLPHHLWFIALSPSPPLLVHSTVPSGPISIHSITRPLYHFCSPSPHSFLAPFSLSQRASALTPSPPTTLSTLFLPL